MEILSEKTEKVAIMECEFTDEEFSILYKHAKENIPPKRLNDLLIGWAVEDALRKYIDAHTKKPAIKKTGKGKGAKATTKRKTQGNETTET